VPVNEWSFHRIREVEVWSFFLRAGFQPCSGDSSRGTGIGSVTLTALNESHCLEGPVIMTNYCAAQRSQNRLSLPARKIGNGVMVSIHKSEIWVIWVSLLHT
jgi:hypothetical protein